MTALIRFALLLTALTIAILLVIAHGVRGIVILIAAALVASVPQSRAWQSGERMLVRLTGSRRRAAVAVATALIGAAIVINVYEFVH